MSEDAPSASPTKAWHPGSDLPTLFDRYQILGVIGQGGMGTVFKGYHLNLKRFVAIKTLRIDQAERAGLVERFLGEMHSIGQMDHPNVVRATDGGEKNGVFYLVMEFLTGLDLGRLVAARGALAPADACELARQAALGLDYVHQTLVHRDIKPSNLMLTTAGLVKILDLGLARLEGEEAVGRERTPVGCPVGTYDYMAPEQAAAAGPIDGRADLYSLGCTLFKLLTGRVPFGGPEYGSAARKLYAHCHVPLSATEGFAALPEQLQPVLGRLTAKDPAERYPTAREVAEVLAPFAAGSRPALLLVPTEDAPTLSVQPLPQPLPEELSRLTQAPNETRPHSPELRGPAAPAPPAAAPPRQLPRPRRRLLLGAAILACAMGVLAWFLVPALLHPRRGKEGDKGREAAGAGPRALDKLAPRTWHPLLDQPPLPVLAFDPEQWRWDQRQETLEVRPGGSLLFLLGTTSRRRYTLEVGMAQSPWTGNVGVFWGYREDTAAKQARKPGQEFAWFQMALVERRPHGLTDQFSVRRYRVTLAYNEARELLLKQACKARQDVDFLPGGERILTLEIAANRLHQARLEAVPLKGLCSDAANQPFEPALYRGGVGLITLGSYVDFKNVRFQAN